MDPINTLEESLHDETKVVDRERERHTHKHTRTHTPHTHNAGVAKSRVMAQEPPLLSLRCTSLLGGWSRHNDRTCEGTSIVVFKSWHMCALYRSPYGQFFYFISTNFVSRGEFAIRGDSHGPQVPKNPIPLRNTPSPVYHHTLFFCLRWRVPHVTR